MILTSQIAQPIVDQIMAVIDYNINIMDHNGIIIASGDKKRIKQKHQGALEAIKLKKERIIYDFNFQEMLSTNVGVNVPIELNNSIVGVVGITGNPNKIYKYIHIIKIMVESLLTQINLVNRLKYKRTAMEDFIINLIDNNYSNYNALRSEADRLKIDYHKKAHFIVLSIMNYIEEGTESEIISSILKYDSNIFSPTHIGKGMFAFLIPTINENSSITSVKNICKNIQDDIKKENGINYIGIGNCYAGVVGYRKSYREAIYSVQLIKKIDNTKEIAFIGEWKSLQAIIQIPQAVIKNFLIDVNFSYDNLGLDTKETLITFLNNNLSVNDTSKILHIHRNTLLYRLNKIKEQTGYDPKKFNDAIHLKNIFWLSKIGKD